MIRIFVLGKFRIEVGGEEGGSGGKSRTGVRPLAFLALLAGKPILRNQMAKELWPEVEHSVGLNRLRVALTRMRGLVGDGMREDEEGIWLDLEVVEIDWVKALGELKLADDAFEVPEEIEIMVRVVEQFECEILEDIDEPWVDEWRLGWAVKVVEICRRLAATAWEIDDFESMLIATRVGLKAIPSDEQLLRYHLMARGARNEGDLGWSDYLTARNSIREDLGRDVSAEIVSLAQGVQSGAFYEERQGDAPGENELRYLGEVLSKIVTTNPDLARTVLSDRSIRFLAPNWINQAIPIYEKLTEDADWSDKNTSYCAELLMQMYGVKYDWEKTLDICEKLLEADIEPHVEAATLRNMGFCYMQMRRYDEAVACSKKAIEIGREVCDDVDLAIFVTNLGSVYMHTANHEEAVELYEEGLVLLEGNDTSRAVINWAVAKLNIGCIRLMEARYEETYELMLEGRTAVEKIGYKVADDMIAGMIGYVQVELGNVDDGVREMIMGLKLAYQKSNYRPQQLNLELAAGILVRLGDLSGAKGVLDWVNEWRIETRHERSPGELMYIERYETAIGDTKPYDLTGLSTKAVFNFVAKRIRLAVSKVHQNP